MNWFMKRLKRWKGLTNMQTLKGSDILRMINEAVADSFEKNVPPAHAKMFFRGTPVNTEKDFLRHIKAQDATLVFTSKTVVEKVAEWVEKKSGVKIFSPRCERADWLVYQYRQGVGWLCLDDEIDLYCEAMANELFKFVD